MRGGKSEITKLENVIPELQKEKERKRKRN